MSTTQTATEVTDAERAMLRVLTKDGEGNLPTLRRRFGRRTDHKPATASKMLTKLSRRGWVDRRADVRNPRADIWFLTDRGRAAAEEVLRA